MRKGIGGRAGGGEEGKGKVKEEEGRGGKRRSEGRGGAGRGGEKKWEVRERERREEGMGNGHNLRKITPIIRWMVAGLKYLHDR